MKTCTKCNVLKPFTEFYKSSKDRVTGLSSCKACDKLRLTNWRKTNRSEYNNYAAAWRAKNPDKQHATDIKRNYGLSIGEYNRLLTEQGCKCKVCGKQHTPSKKRGRLYVDHCHTTGRIRGLLCSACNLALGYAEDSEARLLNLIEYLKRSA